MADHPAVRTWPLSFDISARLPFSGAHAMSGWLMGPVHLPIECPPTLVYCIAGGGQSVSAFDLEVPGLRNFSFAEHLAARGLFVAAFDHPGIGASTPVADLYQLEVSTVASAHAHVVAALKALIGEGSAGLDLPPVDDLRVIGLGHSMGAMVLDVLQARERPFAAIVALGHGGGGLPEVLTPAELALAGRSGADVDERVAELARARFAVDSTVPKRPPAHGTFFGDDVPAEAITAMGDHQTELLYHCALQTLIPGSIAADLAAIDVPVFLGLGEHDLIHDPHSVVASYASASDVTLFVLAGAGHCQLQAGNRVVLWSRLEQWIAAVAAPSQRFSR
jgi:pimeloyl-ACP methyl ester carboxylesterase